MKQLVAFAGLIVFACLALAPCVVEGVTVTEAGPGSQSSIILTPEAPPAPRINGPGIFGVRPGSPFLFTIAATGERPMTFSANHLPDGLQLDPQTGRITGELNQKGEYVVTLRAKNRHGTAKRNFKIICGARIGLTPAMGWNSWNCFASAVTAKDIRSAADAMVSSGLINHGWTYINIDDFWEVNPHQTNDATLQGPQRDANGSIMPNPRFSDMKALADYVHRKGLKIGLYSSPGPWTCGGCAGSWQHEQQDAQTYGQWGFDYLKYDWCTYDQFAKDHSQAEMIKPYKMMRSALDAVPRDIIYSLCYGVEGSWEWGGKVGGNSWRICGDIRDTWESMSGNGFNHTADEPFAGPGHFNDPDMLVVGYVGWGPQLHPTHLTADEQYTHVSLWCLLASPLLIGCDLTRLDPFTLNLLSNDEVLAVDQDPLGEQAKRIARNGDLEVWAKKMEDRSIAVGLFNRGESPAKVEVKWTDLGWSGRHRVRDLWRQKNLGNFRDSFGAAVPRHGVELVRIW
jgi:alpha-galactosidase